MRIIIEFDTRPHPDIEVAPSAESEPPLDGGPAPAWLVEGASGAVAGASASPVPAEATDAGTAPAGLHAGAAHQ